MTRTTLPEPDVRQLLPQIAACLEAKLLWGHDDYRGRPDCAYLQLAAPAITLFASLTDRTPGGWRLVFRGAYPAQAARVHEPHKTPRMTPANVWGRLHDYLREADYPDESITVAADRDPTKVAAEVRRRLVPVVEHNTVALLAKHADELARDAEDKALAERIALAYPGLRMDPKSGYGYRGRPAGRYDGRDLNIEVESYARSHDGETVRLEMSLDEAGAMAVLHALRMHKLAKDMKAAPPLKFDLDALAADPRN